MLSMLLVVNVLTGISTGIIFVVLPLYAYMLGAGTAEIGMIRGFSGIGALLIVLPAGIMIDRFGAENLYFAGTLGAVLGVLLLMVAGSAQQLALIMLLQGIAGSLRFISLNAAFFQRIALFGQDKAGWYRGSLSVGLTFIGPLLAGVMVDLWTYRGIFLLSMGLILLSGAVLLYVTGKGRQAFINTDRPGTKTCFSLAAEWGEFRGIIANASLRKIFILETVNTACFSAFSVFIILYARNNLGLSAQQGSYYLLAEGLAYIFTVFCLGKFLYAKLPNMKYFFSKALACAGLLCLGAAGTGKGNEVLLAVGVLLFGIGIGLLNILTFSALGEAKEKKGKVSGMLSLCVNMGAAIGPFLAGAVGGQFGLEKAFLALIPLIVLAGIYCRFEKY